MKIEIQSDSSTANSLTDRLGAGQRTKHIDARYFWIQERIQGGDLSIKKVPTAKNLRRCWNEASLCFSTTTTLQVCRIGILLTMDPTPHHKMKVTSLMMESGDGDCKLRCGHIAKEEKYTENCGTETDSCQR